MKAPVNSPTRLFTHSFNKLLNGFACQNFPPVCGKEELRKGLPSWLFLAGLYFWGEKSSGFEVLLNRSFCSCDSKSTGLVRALPKELLREYENVLKSGCPGNECMEAEAEGGTDDRVFQA